MPVKNKRRPRPLRVRWKILIGVASVFVTLIATATLLALSDSQVSQGNCFGGVSGVGPVYAPCSSFPAAIATGILSLVLGTIFYPFLVVPGVAAGSVILYFGMLAIVLRVRSTPAP